MKRFYVYNYLIGSPILIDTKKKQFIFYKTNIHGQIYNIKDIKDEDILKPSKQKINGLIKRANNRNYIFSNNYVIDPYIYNYIMTEEEKGEIGRDISLNERGFIAAANNVKEVLETTCQWALEYKKDASYLNTEEGKNSMRILKEHIQEAAKSDLFN